MICSRLARDHPDCSVSGLFPLLPPRKAARKARGLLQHARGLLQHARGLAASAAVRIVNNVTVDSTRKLEHRHLGWGQVPLRLSGGVMGH